MSKRFLLILASIIVVFGGLLIFNKRGNNAENSNGDGQNSQSQLSKHVIPGKSGVTLVEWGDFQCPGCGAMFPVVEQLRTKYAGEVTFQFSHYPLVEIHQNALIAARAAEAASMQGKFWEMHDKLFQNQQVWSSNTSPNTLFEEYAKQIGLDVEKFKSDQKSEQVNNIVQADRKEAQKKGFKGTPTFVLDGKEIKTPNSLEEFEKIIDEALANKKKDNQKPDKQ